MASTVSASDIAEELWSVVAPYMQLHSIPTKDLIAGARILESRLLHTEGLAYAGHGKEPVKAGATFRHCTEEGGTAA